MRTIAAHWDGSTKNPGWNFGITGKQSRRKPQTVVLQLVGHDRDGKLIEEAAFSDHATSPAPISLIIWRQR